MIDERKFWSHVDRRDAESCWPWKLSLGGPGYGQVADGRTMRGTHRVAYEFANGPIPEGLCVCHTCDNRTCCNPAHLWLGTRTDNNRDMFSKGRGRPVPQRGAQHKLAKLTEAAAQEIYARYQVGDVTQRDLAAEYGVSQVTVWKVCNRKGWAHAVPEAAHGPA